MAGRCLAGLRAGEDCSTETLHLNKTKSMGRLLDVVCSSQQRGPTTPGPRLDGLILRAAAAAKRQPDAAATTGGGGPCWGLKRAAADGYRRLRHLGPGRRITSSVRLSRQEARPAAVQHATCASGQGCC